MCWLNDGYFVCYLYDIQVVSWTVKSKTLNPGHSCPKCLPSWHTGISKCLPHER